MNVPVPYRLLLAVSSLVSGGNAAVIRYYVDRAGRDACKSGNLQSISLYPILLHFPDPG